MHPIQAIRAFSRVLFKGEQAAAPPPPSDAFQSSDQPAVQVLGLLQKDGRLIDFLMEDISSYSDSDVGSAARRIHEDCSKVLRERFAITPIRNEAEGETVQLAEEPDTASHALSGNVSTEFPAAGKISHRGWRAADVKLPTVPPGSDASVIAPAEIEIQGGA